ncbi:MAG: hydrogenase maturation protease [Candidatus Asgardarchaeia archaeon]
MILDNVDDELLNFLRNAKKVVICGVGNELKSDDRIGLLIAEALQKEVNSPKMISFICGSAPEGFSGKVLKEKPTHFVIIDAAQFGYPPGSIGLFEPEEIEGIVTSTHSLPLSLMCKYLHMELKGEINIKVVGIQIKNLELGDRITPEVLAAKDKIVSIFKMALEA